MEPPPRNSDSLRQVFGGASVETFKKNLAEVLTSDEYAALREEAGEHLGALPWPGAARQIAQEAALLVDTPLTPALKKVYGSANLLHRYLDRSQYDPEEVIVVELAEHTITSSYAPTLDVVINEYPIPALRLDVEVALALKGLILKIQDATIRQITPGTCQASGTIAFHGHVLAEQQSAPLVLPPLDLGDGLPIAPGRG